MKCRLSWAEATEVVIVAVVIPIVSASELERDDNCVPQLCVNIHE